MTFAIVLADGLCEFEGLHLLKVCMIAEGGLCTSWTVPSGISLTTEEDSGKRESV
jgi:hypothetical protein